MGPLCGWRDGWLEGHLVGCPEGISVGLLYGCPLGLSKGWLEGWLEGKLNIEKCQSTEYQKYHIICTVMEVQLAVLKICILPKWL